MLTLHNQLEDLIKNRFPAKEGAYFFVRDTETGIVIPEQPGHVLQLLDTQHDSGIDNKDE